MLKTLLFTLITVLTISVVPVAYSADSNDVKIERHPEMIHALKSLENAKNHLEKAAHDFGGDRAKALEHTEEAIKEVKEALQFDKKGSWEGTIILTRGLLA
jgi:hypothetical protein